MEIEMKKAIANADLTPVSYTHLFEYQVMTVYFQ